jgi:hypothetical protein
MTKILFMRNADYLKSVINTIEVLKDFTQINYFGNLVNFFFFSNIIMSSILDSTKEVKEIRARYESQYIDNRIKELHSKIDILKIKKLTIENDIYFAEQEIFAFMSRNENLLKLVSKCVDNSIEEGLNIQFIDEELLKNVSYVE